MTDNQKPSSLIKQLINACRYHDSADQHFDIEKAAKVAEDYAQSQAWRILNKTTYEPSYKEAIFDDVFPPER